MKRIGHALGAAALLALGTAGAQGTESAPAPVQTKPEQTTPEKAKDQYLFLRTPTAAVTLKVAGNDITGPDIQLSRQGDALRGRAFGRVVFLNLDDQKLGGTVGSSLTRLTFENKGQDLDVRGTFGGKLTHLTIGPEALNGSVGRCGYQLKANADGDYVGSRSCGGIPQQPVTLDIPPALKEQGTPMTLATLALLLGSY